MSNLVYASNRRALDVVSSELLKYNQENLDLFLVSYSSILENHALKSNTSLKYIYLSKSPGCRFSEYFNIIKFYYKNHNILRSVKNIYFNTEYFPFIHVLYFFKKRKYINWIQYPDFMLVSLFYNDYKVLSFKEILFNAKKFKRILPYFFMHSKNFSVSLVEHVFMVEIPGKKQIFFDLPYRNLMIKPIDRVTFTRSNFNFINKKTQQEDGLLFVSQAMELEISDVNYINLVLEMCVWAKKNNTKIKGYKPHPREQKDIVNKTYKTILLVFNECELLGNNTLTDEQLQKIKVTSVIGFYSDLMIELASCGYGFISFVKPLFLLEKNLMAHKAFKIFDDIGINLDPESMYESRILNGRIFTKNKSTKSMFSFYK